jgi:hypothetical protein
VTPKTRLFWKWEDEQDDGAGVGPVWLIHTDGRTEDWDRWVVRSEAANFAEAHGYEFVPDE